MAASDCTVLIVGESGTGKEVLARFIHRSSDRANKPFVAVNCAAIPETMLEAMLFGYERGAFTGAVATHAGKFEQAQGGTLLLDEITEMPLSLQAKLLRVLQEREVERLGGRTPVPLDVRVLATTNRRLREEVAAGRFREDLYYRLNVFPLAISPLSTRRDDVLPLAMQLLARRVRPGDQNPCAECGCRAPAADVQLAGQRARAGQPPATRADPGERAGDRSRAHPVRARERDVRAVGYRNVPHLHADAAGMPQRQPRRTCAARSRPLAPQFGAAWLARAAAAAQAAAPADASLARTLGNAEKDLILEALRSGSPRREVAERLGISPRTLRHKLARLREAGVEVPAA